ncbi:MAG: hypothetical protein LBE35_03495 [Clostridiales bacterium]|jgi:uncharacterized protein (UPF0335 family)|nr:hypothetical protein [Clostridiales bacterium]
MSHQAFDKPAFKEKALAWRQIIDIYPDMPIPESNGFPDARESLHEYLKERVERTEAEVSEFLTPHKDMFYSPKYMWWNTKTVENPVHSNQERRRFSDIYHKTMEGIYKEIEKFTKDYKNLHLHSHTI